MVTCSDKSYPAILLKLKVIQSRNQTNKPKVPPICPLQPPLLTLLSPPPPPYLSTTSRQPSPIHHLTTSLHRPLHSSPSKYKKTYHNLQYSTNLKPFTETIYPTHTTSNPIQLYQNPQKPIQLTRNLINPLPNLQPSALQNFSAINSFKLINPNFQVLVQASQQY